MRKLKDFMHKYPKLLGVLIPIVRYAKSLKWVLSLGLQAFIQRCFYASILLILLSPIIAAKHRLSVSSPQLRARIPEFHYTLS